ncbi:hypothetical protein ACFW6S_22580 [Streptomyces sp. NPDC058740]|uniref:hypothetical protein n=1 Tax=Streptomyces sp. NPDC058740 TaxID=3346619 RepID=UPI0036A59F68
MTYRRAAIPALIGGLLLTALLWWAGASSEALRLPGSQSVLGFEQTAELARRLAPWTYAPASGGTGDATVVDGSYLSLRTTAMQIRFCAVLAFFVPGALLLARRLPPVQGRMPATLLALWAWGIVAGVLAVTVSAPWLIASGGRGSYRILPQLASVIASGRQPLVAAALVTAVVTALIARITAKGAGNLPRADVPARPARQAATAGTAVIAFSLLVLSYESVAAAIQTAPAPAGLLDEPGDLLRQWLLLGAWAGPAGVPFTTWLLYRAADLVVLALVWWGLRRLPGLLTRVTVPAMAAGAVSATVIGLLVSQSLRIALDGTGRQYGLLYAFGNLGNGVPAALIWGVAAGVVAALTLRVALRREGAAGERAAGQTPGDPQGVTGPAARGGES